MGSFPGVAGGPGSRCLPGGHQPLLLLVSAATSSACGPRSISLPWLPPVRRFLVKPRMRGNDVSPCFGSRGLVGPRARELPVAADPEPVDLGVEGAFASSTPPPAAPDAEQHRGADQRARRRQCGHDRLPTLLALLGPLLVSIHDNSRRGGQLRIGNVLRDRRLRSPPDDWERTAVIWRTTQSP